MMGIVTMREVDLRKADLNLLVMLDVLLEERNVTRAALRLGLSQPAASRALARLRALFGDPLLVEGAGGYLLSARAETLRPSLRTALADLGGLLQPEAFDPATAKGRIRLVMPDLLAAVLMPHLLGHLTTDAPGLDLEVLPPSAQLFETLEDDRADAIIGLIETAPAAIRRRNLFDERMVTLMRQDHPVASRELTLDRFLSLDHIVVSITGIGTTPVDNCLQRIGHSRRIKVRVPSFFTALEIAAHSDLVVTLPACLADTALAQGRFATSPPPLELGVMPMSLCWHARHHDSQRHRWLRQAIVAAAAQVKR